MQWTVRRKLVALAGFWAAMLLVVSGMGLMTVHQSRERTDRLSAEQLTTLHTLGDIRWYAALVRTAAVLTATGSGATVEQQASLGDERRDQLQKALTRLKAIPHGPETTALVRRLDQTVQDYLAVREQVTAHARAGRQSAARAMMQNQAGQTFGAVVSVADTMATEALHEADAARQDVATLARRLQAVLIGLVVLVMALTGWITWRMTAGIDRQVQALRSAMRRVAEGDLSTGVEVTSRDELGTLAEHFNWLVGELRGILQSVAGNADRLHDTARQLSQAANDAAQASREVAGTVEQLAMGSGTQAEAVQQGALETQRMSEAATVASTGIIRVDQAASGAADAADRGLASLQTVAGKVQDLHAAVQGSAEAVTTLHELSQQIGAIIAMIKGIASQTNLLALNAAIEAARAGEQGRGFAVVAEEVRKLAADSAGNAEQITRMITATQSETQRAMDLISRGMAEANQAVRLINETHASFDQVHHAVSDTHHGVRDISASMQTLSTSLLAVSSGMESVAAVAEENAASAEEVSAAVQEQSALVEQVSASSGSLADMSDDMMRLATRFRLSPGTLAMPAPGGPALAALTAGRA